MSTKVITNEDWVVQSQGFMVSEIDGEKVMLSIENGKYYNLGQIGGRIWEIATEPVMISKMVEELVLEYTVETEACEQQVLAFVNQLVGEGLLQVKQL